MKRALILGVSGQDGSYLAERLVKKGYKVFGSSRDAEVSSFTNLTRLGIKDQVELLSLSIKDYRSVLQTFGDLNPDEVYNLSGQSSVSLSFDQPVETLESVSTGTLNILEAIRYLKKPIKFYNAASSECFGNTDKRGANELTPFQPRSPYAVAKSSAFWLVANYREAFDLFACSGILFNHESALRPQRFVTKKIISAAARIAQGSEEKLNLGNIEISRDWGFAKEYVIPMHRMLQLDRPEDFVIASGESCSLKDFVRLCFENFNLDWKDHVKTDPAFMRPTDISFSKGNPAKAKDLLEWEVKADLKDIIKIMSDFEISESV